jgi:hypothetical protein
MLMDHKEFGVVRQKFEKTQKQMAELLGISLKAIQSFEQGWRKVPVYIERQLLFLWAAKMGPRKGVSPCWKIRNCPPEVRETCPAWEFNSGHLCWFINGTICRGKPQESWSKKMKLCRKCTVFSSVMKNWSLPSERKPSH